MRPPYTLSLDSIALEYSPAPVSLQYSIELVNLLVLR